MPSIMVAEQISPAAHLDAPAVLQDGLVVLHGFPSQDLERRWLDCLSRSTAPAHYASPAFFREPYFRDKRPFAVLAIQGDHVTGVLTGLHDGDQVVSGLETRVHIAVDESRDPAPVLQYLVDGLEQESSGASLVQTYSWRPMQMAPFLRAGYRKREFTGNPIFDLTQGAEPIIKAFGKSQRHNIRLAKKSGIEIVEATTREEFEEFYAIYAQWCQVKRTSQFSKEMELEAFETTRGNRAYFLARYEGKTIAGSIVRFYPGGLVECSRNSSLPQFRNLKPNDLLIAFTIEWAAARGFQRLSLGAHHKFLRGFGGTIVPIDRYRKDRTLFRRHDLSDFAKDISRAAFYRLSATQQQKVRKLLRKEKPAGW